MEHLAQLLAADSQQGLNSYALVDPALRSDVLKASIAQRRVALHLAGTDRKTAEAVLPFLIPLSPSGRDFAYALPATRRWAEEDHAVTWLSSRLPIDTLARELGARMEVRLPDNVDMILRYPDSRVLPVLHGILTPAQRDGFFTVAQHWWYLDRQGQLQGLPLTGAQAAFSAPQHLDDAQQNALIEAAEPDAVIAILHEQPLPDFQQMTQPQRYAFVVEQMQRANTWNIASPKDQAVFCMAALQHGDAFCDAPEWQAALGKVKQDGTSLIAALSGRA